MIELKAIVEGLLFASGNEGISGKRLARIARRPIEEIDHILQELQHDYSASDRGIHIIEDRDGFQLVTKPEHSSYLQNMLETAKPPKMSQAALETLAIIAYQQPITRTEIEDIRGVKSDRAIQTLLTRYLIEERGRKDSIGRPILFGTATEFLTYFGLTSIDELPPLPEDVNTDNIAQEADLFFETINPTVTERKTSTD